MTLNELLTKYTDREKAARAWARQEKIDIADARFIVTLAAGDTEGDVMVQQRNGTLEAAFPLNKE
jgi:hypothetical protein